MARPTKIWHDLHQVVISFSENYFNKSILFISENPKIIKCMPKTKVFKRLWQKKTIKIIGTNENMNNNYL